MSSMPAIPCFESVIEYDTSRLDFELLPAEVKMDEEPAVSEARDLAAEVERLTAVVGSLRQQAAVVGSLRQQAAVATKQQVPSPGSPSKPSSRRSRITFSERQLDELESAYSVASMPPVLLRQQVAARNGLSMDRVNTWFKNRRAKERRTVAKSASVSRQIRPSSKQAGQILSLPASLGPQYPPVGAASAEVEGTLAATFPFPGTRPIPGPGSLRVNICPAVRPDYQQVTGEFLTPRRQAAASSRHGESVDQKPYPAHGCGDSELETYDAPEFTLDLSRPPRVTRAFESIILQLLQQAP